MQGLRAFCGILKSYKEKYLEKTQLHRLTAKVGLNSAAMTTPLFFKANRADRMETPEMPDLDACPHLGHRIRGGLIPFVCRMALRFSVMRRQKSTNSSHVIALDHVLLSYSSISGNQTRCASPAGISPSPPSRACPATSRRKRWSPRHWA